MKRIIFALGIVFFLSANGQAAIFNDALTGNGTKDTLIDSSVGLFRDIGSGNAGVLGVGDILQGIIKISEVAQDGNFGDTVPINSVFAAYSLELASINSDLYNFRPASGTDSIASILTATGFGPSLLLLNSYSGTTADATMAFFEKAEIRSIGSMIADTDSTPLYTLVGADNRIGTRISAANGWSLSLVAGLVTTLGGDDFFQVKIGDFPTTIPGYSETNKSANYETAMSVIAHSFPASAIFLGMSRVDYEAVNHIGDIVSSGSNTLNTVSSGSQTADTNWMFQDKGNFDINVVPEPASMAMWGIGLSLVLGAGWRARRRKVA